MCCFNFSFLLAKKWQCWLVTPQNCWKDRFWRLITLKRIYSQKIFVTIIDMIYKKRQKYVPLLRIKVGINVRTFSTDTKNNFSETLKFFPKVGKNFRRAGKIQFCQERPGELKRYGKNFSMKTKTLWFNAKIIISREKDSGYGKILWKDTWKESFMFWLGNWNYLRVS